MDRTNVSFAALTMNKDLGTLWLVGHSSLGAIRKGSLPFIGSRGYLLPALRTAIPPCAQSADQLLKGIGVFGGVLEPSQEVEWLSKFSAVMQPSRYGRQVFHTNCNVPRLLLEDGSAFILR